MSFTRKEREMSEEYEDLKEQKNRIIEKDRSTLLRQYRERLDKRDKEITSLRTQLAKKEKEWVGIVTEEMNKNGKLRAQLDEKEKEIKRLKQFIEKGCSDDSSQCCFLTELLYLRDFVDGLKDRAKKAEAELAEKDKEIERLVLQTSAGTTEYWKQRAEKAEGFLAGTMLELDLLNIAYKKLESKLAKKEKEINHWKQTAGHEADGLESWKNAFEKAEAELATLREKAKGIEDFYNRWRHLGVDTNADILWQAIKNFVEGK